MSTDVNNFDSWLKTKLYRDLIFRSVIWLGFSFATGYLAVYRGVSPIEYFDRIKNSISPLVNIVGTFSLLLCVLALMLKDLEATLGCSRLVYATRGHLSGLIRRLAGDLSLWTLGAFVTLISTVALLIVKADISQSDYVPAGLLTLVLLMFIAFISTANVFVRRNGPTPLVGVTNNPLVIAIIYIIFLATLIFNLAHGSA